GERGENLELAIACYQAALQVYTPDAFSEKWATTQNNLGNAYSDRIRGERGENLESAIACFQAALQVRTPDAFPQNHTETLNNLSLTYQAQSQHYTDNREKQQIALQNAYETFARSLNAVEYLRGEIVSGDEAKRKLNEEWNRLYLGIIEVCLQLDNHRAAIEYTDRSKARNLVELIAIRDAYPQGEIPPEERQYLQDLRQAIARERHRLEQEEEQNRDYTQIARLRQEFRAKSPYKPLNFDEIQSLLDEETAIFEWYILNDKFLTFTLTAQTLDLWISSPEDLEQLIDWTKTYLKAYYAAKAPDLSKTEAEKLRQEWQNSLPQSFETLSEILHLSDRLNTLLTKFPTCKKLILIPHLYLHLFPIHALPVTCEDETKPLQEWLAKGVSYVPNCQLLRQAQNRYRPHFNRLLAISNPSENLSFADLEVETIRESFPKDQRTTLQGKNAKKATVLANDFSQIHHLYFSGHGAFNPNSPLDSGLQLADDVLTLTEIISSLNLSQCSLVTLSACETGQVALDRTDEYLSLSSGFILAGSPSAIVSLWSIHQVSTALLLIKTYEALKKHPGKLAISLKTAQMWLRDTPLQGFHHWTQASPLLNDYWRDRLRASFQKMVENREWGWDDRPYESPYHWAAFCIVGKGEQPMSSDDAKLQAFLDLVENNPDNLFAQHWQSLTELQRQFTDNDEKNVAVIETWLEKPTRAAISQAYQTRSQSSEPISNKTVIKGGFGSKATSKQASKSYGELIEQATKKNTPQGDSANPKPPEKS
ncbi:MAG: CHAT domain-containing protein, partial [Spirulina sp.]